jgi:H+/Cl- antiporter ClcA
VYIIILLLSSDLTALVFAWDFVIFILYAALFGLFGKMYIGASDAYQSGIHRMKNAVWIDCINMILWFISAVAGIIMFFLQKRNGRRSLHTGRAKV